jgi:uncharacterized protein (TIGR03437 family)
MRASVFVLTLAAAAWGQAPSGLTAKAATNKKVDLAWTGSAASYTVQRRVLGGSYGNIATVNNATTYSDTTIDAYTSYQYQIVAGTSTPSNQITVGPPPAGFSTVAPAPGPEGSYIAGNYGYDLSAVLDANGDPAFAWVFYDPNADSDPSDTRIEFRSWNRALYKWNDIVHAVTNTGDIATQFSMTISLAFDTSNGTFAIANETGTGTIQLWVSTDSGVTWTRKNTFDASANSAWYTTPSLALNNGTLHLAFVHSSEGMKYVTGQLSAAPATWITRSEPANSNLSSADGSTTISLALDSNGNPGIAWFADDQKVSYNRVLQYWRPGSAPVKIMDTQGHQSDGVAVKLVYSGLNPRVLAELQRADADFGVLLHTARSDSGGATWNAPVVIPPDGTSSTDYPFDLAVDSRGNGVAAFGQNGGTGDTVCGWPKISRTADFVTWKTCDVVNDVKITGDYTVIPDSIQLRFGGNDKLYMLWWDNAGILMYREPPPTTVTAPNISSVVNGATFQPGIVAGSWTTITGVNMSDVSRSWTDADFNNGNILPTNLSGVQVKINNLDAPVYYISPTQINVQAPGNLSGNVNVQVIRGGVSSNSMTANAVSTAPGLFTYALGGKTYPSALYNGTYTIVGDPALYSSAAKAKSGDIIQLYGTGLGASPAGNIISSPITFSSPVTVGIGSSTVNASFAGLVGVGLFQINFTVPAGLADGDYPLTIKVNGVSSQSGVILPVTH